MQHIFDKLELSNATNLHPYTKYSNNDLLPLRINKSLHAMKISPKFIFIFENKPFILFFDHEVIKEDIFKQCWNFSEAPIVAIEAINDFEVYNGYEFILNNGNFSLNPLDKNLNYLSIMNGDYVKSAKFQRPEKTVDRVLLKNIKKARELLIYELASNNLQNKRKYNQKKKIYAYVNLNNEEDEEYKIIKNIANSLIGRIIFTRYLIDREVSIGYKHKGAKLSKNDLINILNNYHESYKLFEYLKSDKGFNGDWFPITNDEKKIVGSEHLKILKELLEGKDFETGEGTLFNFYDFSIIPIEFISNVYESFIGETEQSESGAFYTPSFLVDYILHNTLDKYFTKNKNEYNCKVLDPACGSGIFLVETLRKLINQYITINGNISSSKIIDLVRDNIFAIDKDKDAVLISIFSIYLTMLDYQEPADIEKFVFPYLIESPKNTDPNDINFFVDDFFDTDAKYNKILENKKIDFIIGNPPYKRSGGGSECILNYIKNRQKLEKTLIGYSNKEIAQAFLIRASDISKEATISFIINSKIFYNLQAQNYRKYFLNNYSINHILELSSVRKEIFGSAVTPVMILFYKYDNVQTKENRINYASIKPSLYFDKLKILFLSKNDYKTVSQEKLKTHDYLWKILVYGSYLDFNLVKKLKTHKTINDYIETNNLNRGMGINVGTYKNTDVTHYLGEPFIDASKKQIRPFYISNNLSIWNTSHVQIPSKEILFEPFSVLTPQGLDISSLKTKSAIIYKKALFKDTISSIHVPTKKIAQNILAILNSSLSAYIILQQTSSAGIEREKILHSEKISLPFIENADFSKIVSKIERLIKKNEEDNILVSSTYKQELSSLIGQLDQNVLDIFNFSKKELALIDYTNKIIIPWVIQKKYDIAYKRLSPKSIEIKTYINIFEEQYSQIYEQYDKYFATEVVYSDYAIGIKFKVLNERPSTSITWTEESKLDNFIQIFGAHPIEHLFIQKDIKGFEEDYFYVVKPNEYKNWHEAIGYLDFHEFDNAILDAGSNS